MHVVTTKNPCAMQQVLYAPLSPATPRALVGRTKGAMRRSKAAVAPRPKEKKGGTEIEGLTEGTIDDLREAFGLFDKVCRQPTRCVAGREPRRPPLVLRCRRSLKHTLTRSRALGAGWRRHNHPQRAQHGHDFPRSKPEGGGAQEDDGGGG